MRAPRVALLPIVCALLLSAASHGATGKKTATAAPGGVAPLAPAGVFSLVAVAPGAMNHTNAATVVHCTNLGNALAAVMVRFDNFDGSPACTLFSLPVLSNETWTASTRATAVFTENAICDGGTPAINQGVVRVLLDPAQEMDVVCSIQVVDPVAASPVYASALEVHPR